VFQSEVPFNERGGRLRGALDLVSGRFPRFVFGGAVPNTTLPVFHFHDETRESFEPKLRYLVENGYRTVSNDEVAAFAAGHGTLPKRAVGLCFDDAWASLWTVVAPLLKEYGRTAIVYAIPGRIERADSPFVSWDQLRQLHGSGLIDVQCHTYSHSRIFTASRLAGFVTPDYGQTPYLNRPQLAAPPDLQFVTDRDLGAPIYPSRSRMSDGRRVMVSPDAHRACVALVAREGGVAFFSRPNWRESLEAIASTTAARPETEADQLKAIEEELDRGRSTLNERLRTTSVNHICLPWGVSGQRTSAALKRLGFRSAFANRLRGIHAVRQGDDLYWLKRLPNKYIRSLPGHGRRTWV
jgi:peptidoglycan/xylan/chitin deacetylase (PgdA/CDA1 family)